MQKMKAETAKMKSEQEEAVVNKCYSPELSVT